MSTVLPGKPQARLQAVATFLWKDRHIDAYISGSAITILNSSHTIIQSIYNGDEEPLDAIAVDEATGKIAVASPTQVRLYKPEVLQDDRFEWALESCLKIPHTCPDMPCSISWGNAEELLIGTTSLSLYTTKSRSLCSWQKKLASPVRLALLSYDSAYVACIGLHDALVKVWRRLTYGSNDVRFDLSYIPHPDVVTSIRWRKPFHVEQSAQNVLYTVCLDGFVRIWVSADSADWRHWQLWGRVNVSSNYGEEPRLPLICMVDGRDFTASVERAVKERMVDHCRVDDIAMDHLVAIANKNPELCLAFDRRGAMSAWALENIGNSTADSMKKIFTVAEVNSDCFVELNGFMAPNSSTHIEIQAYCDKTTGRLRILMHAFDGRIGTFTSNVADLLDPTTNDRRLSLHSIWSGHCTPIIKINRNFSGRAVVSRTECGETIVWSHVIGRVDTPSLRLVRRSVIPEQRQIHRVCVLRKGRFVVLLQQGVISLWDCRVHDANCLARCQYNLTGEPLCLIILPRRDVKDSTTAYITTVTSLRQGIVWEVSLPQYSGDPVPESKADIREFCRFNLAASDDLKRILPVDPAGSSPIASGFLDVFARDIAISYTQSGRVDFWTARLNSNEVGVDWLSTCFTYTGIAEPALVSGSMLKKAALVDSSKSVLTIWDISSSRLEFEESYSTHNTIQDLDWTSSPDAQSILAVGFQYTVLLLSQMRFDYLNKGPAWAAIREINLRKFTPHPIGDSVWLGNGHLVIGAGNQLFVYDRSAKNKELVMDGSRTLIRKDGTWDLFEAVQRFNGSLPVFHPQFLSQCILSGKGKLVGRILISLHEILKFLVPGESVDNYLGLDPQLFYVMMEAENHVSSKATSSDLRVVSQEKAKAETEPSPEIFTEKTALAINERLTKIGIPQLSGQEQIQLADLIECIASVEIHRRSLDENGARFILLFRQHALRNRRLSKTPLSWREINWAYHSNGQDILRDFVSRLNPDGMVWETARECGIFMWLSDIDKLREQFEIVAKNEYTRSETRNPVNCSLFYLALGKKATLQGLWRMANGNKEQAATQRLLANDFKNPKWRRAALKNAYALLSKRRFEYASAFFLLADHLGDAVEVCMHQIGDVQLAVAISRVYEGDNGPVLQKLLREEILPMAAQEGNRWLASWSFWMLGRKDMAVRTLITPISTLLETSPSQNFKSHSLWTDDPALAVLYAQLRQQSLQTLQGASKVVPKAEWEFVLHSAKLYDRMGCDFLGLDLVRNWEFQQTAKLSSRCEINPLQLLRRRSSLVVDDIPQSPQEPSQFQEPDFNSLLNNFGL